MARSKIGNLLAAVLLSGSGAGLNGLSAKAEDQSAQSNTSAGAQATGTGPVDIQANEQEFSGDQILAKGNVRVTYKDTVILAPAANLFRDPAGQPQKAVFNGHPHLTQGDNKIDAEELIFEIQDHKILASGGAHSEVASEEASNDDPTKTTGAQRSKGPPRAAGGQEKIITDSDKQIYDKESGRFEATGHVRVIHGDTVVKADSLRLIYGTDKRPETALFYGNAVATQGQNTTRADNITYSLRTRRLQASGHVRSKVIQQKASTDAGGRGVDSDGASGAQTKELAGAGPGSAMAATMTDTVTHEADPIFITSDSQDYSRDTGRMNADGHVRVFYQQTVGSGPKVIMVKNDEGRPEKVIFLGRSQITQAGKRWIADRITLTVASKKVLAEGNSQAFILQSPTNPQPAAPARAQEQLAGRADARNKLSSTKFEAVQ